MKKRFWSIIFVLAVCGCATLACLGLAGAAEINQAFYDNFTNFTPTLTYAEISRPASGNDKFVMKVDMGEYNQESINFTAVMLDEAKDYKLDMVEIPADEASYDPQGKLRQMSGEWCYFNMTDMRPASGTIVYVETAGILTAGSQMYGSQFSNTRKMIIPAAGNSYANPDSGNSTVAVGGDLSEAVITLDLDNNTATYTGKAIEPGVTVELNGAKLTQGTDYTVEYKDNINVGTAKVLAIGKGSYTGTAQTNFTIVEEGKIDISKAVITLENKTMVYTGKAQEPAVVSVVLDGKTLNPSSDYSVSYENNVNAGTGAAVVKGKGAFTGSGKKEFEIKKAKNKITISPTKKTLKYAKLQKKNQKVKLTIKVLGKAGKTVVIKSVPKKVKKYFSINSATGKITVKKGIPKGTYKLKIQVTTAETANYLKTTKVQVIKITIK